MPLRLRKAILVLLATSTFLAGAPGCVGLRAYEVACCVPTQDGTGSVEIDLVGVRRAAGQRPDGVDVVLRRVDTDQDLFMLTECAGPTKIDHLPPGRYEVRVQAQRLGGPRNEIRRTFHLEAGSRMRIILVDGRADWALFMGKAGHVALEAAKVTAVVTLYTLYIAAHIAASGGGAGGCR